MLRVAPIFPAGSGHVTQRGETLLTIPPARKLPRPVHTETSNTQLPARTTTSDVVNLLAHNAT